MTKSNNGSLGKARDAKQDEFYTQLGDISNELKHYKDQLRGKTIFCNCDDPYESNFFKYFALNFNALGLKKLIATSYKGSPIAGTELSLFPAEEIGEASGEVRESYAIEINAIPGSDGSGAIDLTDVEYLLKNDSNTSRKLSGDAVYGAADFRSAECVELLKQSDIVITNPPFSLFRDFVAQLVEHDKQFLIIGNKNAITYKEIFPLIQQNKLWLGQGFAAGKVEDYMSKHQHDSDAQELWQYFQAVIGWVQRIFPTYRSLMKGLDWGEFYNTYKDAPLNAAKLEQRTAALIEDDEVNSKKGIYEYLLTGSEKTLSLRAFDQKTKVTAYEKQKGICPVCQKHYEIGAMEADHIVPWSKGGKTVPENCQMLCQLDNRTKSGK